MMSDAPANLWPGRLLRWGLRLVGPALLVGLLIRTDREALWATLQPADLRWFTLAVAGWLVIAAVKGLRWAHLLKGQGINLPPARALLWYLASLFLGGVTPGRLGELAKVALVKDLGHPLGRALFATVTDRILDLIVLPFIIMAGLIFYGSVLADGLLWVALGVAGTAIGGVILWRGRRLLLLPIKALAPASLRTQARTTIDDFMVEMSAIPPGRWAAYAAVTTACWILYGATVFSLALSLGITVDPVYLGVTALLAALAGLIPITVSGIGTRDAVFAVVLGRVGVPLPEAIALSMLMLALHLTVIAFEAIPWALVFLRRPRTD